MHFNEAIYLWCIEGGIVKAETRGGRTDGQLGGLIGLIAKRGPHVDSEVIRDVDRVLWRNVDGLDVLGWAKPASLWRGYDVSLFIL